VHNLDTELLEIELLEIELLEIELLHGRKELAARKAKYIF
jgi:hypothetical protein